MSKIIIADDNRAVVMYLAEMVKRLGHEPIQCSNGKEALNKFIEERADLLLLDNSMPVMDGLQVCREVRKLPEGVHVPIIIVSGYNSESNIMEGLDAGASDYLAKPIVEAHLIAKVKTYLKTHSLFKNDFDLVKQHVVLFNRYEIKRFVGYGSHSVVFLASDKEIEGKMVAVKLLHENAVINEIAQAFIENARQFSKLESENIIRILDFGEFTGRLYLIQEFAEGGDLANILKYRNFDQMEAFKLASDLIQALKCLSAANVIHLDIKPENIMVSGENYKLGDFGINAMVKKTGTVPINHTIWGTMAYSSPEVIESPASITHKSDVYSLGIVLYQSLTGDNPFESDKPAVIMARQINFTPPAVTDHHREFSKSFSSLIQQMLNKDPEKRLSAAELEKLLPPILKEISATPETKIPSDFKKEAGADKNKQVVQEQKAANPSRFSFLKKAVSAQKLASAATVLLAFCISVGVGFAAYKVFNHFIFKGPTVLVGAVNVTMCSKCGLIEERRSQDIKDIKCGKCGERLGYARTCNKCGRTYPYIPLTIEELPKNKAEYAKMNAERQQCPICKSQSTTSSVLTEKQKEQGPNPVPKAASPTAKPVKK